MTGARPNRQRRPVPAPFLFTAHFRYPSSNFTTPFPLHRGECVRADDSTLSSVPTTEKNAINIFWESSPQLDITEMCWLISRILVLFDRKREALLYLPCYSSCHDLTTIGCCLQIGWSVLKCQSCHEVSPCCQQTSCFKANWINNHLRKSHIPFAVGQQNCPIQNIKTLLPYTELGR